jgi:cell division protein FtsB
LTQQITQQAEINTELKERNRILAAEVFDLKMERKRLKNMHVSI